MLTENQKRAGAILSATEQQQQSPIYRATHPEVAEEELNSPVALAGAKQALADVMEGQNEEVRARVDQMALVLQDGQADPTEELTKLFSDESLSDNDRQSILDVVTAQSRLATIERSHQEAIAQMQSELTEEWSAKSVVGDETARGAVISATITDADGKAKQVYVTGGVRCVMNEDGTVELLPTDDDAPIYVYDESVDGEEKGHIVQMDDLSSPQLVAEDYLDVVQASLDEAETAFRSEVQAAEGQISQEQAPQGQAPQNAPEDAGDTTDDFMQSLPRTREGEVDGLKLMSERPDDFIRYLGQLYGEDFVASLPLSKSGALDLKALTPEQTLRVNEAALGKSGAVEAARQRRSKVGAERSKLEAEVKSDLGNLEKRMALRKASEEYRLYDDYVRAAEEQARQELEAQKRSEEEALTPEERQRREEEKRQLAQEKKEREERIRLENERRRREREELERNAEGSTVREYTEDPPRQARARGARLVNGAVVYRQEPMTVEHYADAERAFSQRPGETRIPVKRTIVEAESLQASHKEGRMNPRHFIPEAQPKDRADNGLSSTAADRIASNIRPDEITGGITAYTGAPVVNGRGEVIQGNNRTDALQTMYDGEERHAKSAELYKEYLKAHASEYGMTAEQVDAMAHPVAVDVAEVSDSEAIRLGHRGQTDLESAGADTMNAQTVGEELNSDTDPQSGQPMLVSFFNRIFSRTGANGIELSAKMDNMLNRNAEEGLQFLLKNGYITDTQYKNAFETNSEGKRIVTAEAKTALKDVALYQLADVIGPRAMDIFYRLPASARNGLATFLYRDSQASFETSLAPDLGDALLVWDSLRQDPDFSGLTNFESAKIFILGKVSLFGRSELETNLGEASSLAKLLAASMQTQTEEQIAGALNKYYDLVGANETGTKTQSLMPTSQPTDTKAGAAEAVYGRVYEVPSGREKHYRFRRDVAEDFRARRDALADRITEERRKRAAAMDMSRTFGVPMKLHEDMSTLPKEVRAGFDETHFVKGWFYKGDNAIHIYLPANVDADDVRATFLHEAVGHYGCRELLGEVGYNQVLDGIANKLGEEEVLRAMSEYCNGSQDLTNLGQVRIAMDEWIAHRAESGITKRTVWESVKDFFRKVFGLSGKQIDQSAEMMADDLLRRSAENLQKRAERQQGVATEVSPELSPERSEVRFRSNRSAADFARLRDAAIEQKGLVAPGLKQSSVKVTPVRRHNFTGTGLQAIEKARVWAKHRIVKDHWYHKGKSDGFKYLIDENGIGKFLSGSSTKNSDNLGLHLAILKKLPRIIDESILAETHADYRKVDGKRSPENGVDKPTMLVHRLYGAVKMNGELYRVKTTLHERYNADDRAYDYMVTSVELVISGSSTSDALTNSTRKSLKDIAVAKLLKGVEKSYAPGKQLLDESESTGSEEQTSRFRRVERDEIRSRAIEDGTWMKAPNGENSNLSERDWVTVRTKAFKDWFGDWADKNSSHSLIVDSNGEPLPVYHYTSEDFTVFDRSKARKATDVDGFFFAPSHEDWSAMGDKLITAFLNIRRPAINPVLALGQTYDAGVKERLRLEREGYDGIINGDSEEGIEYVAFYPNQIKRTDGEAFSPNSDDIRFRRKVEQNKEEVNRTFNEELEKFAAGELPPKHVFNLGYPSPILISAGILDAPIEITSRIIKRKSSSAKHVFDPLLLRDLPKALQHPIAITEYKKEDNHVNIIVELTNNGENLLVGVKASIRNRSQVNDVKGLFHKSTSGWLRWLEGEKVRYVNNEKVQEIKETRRTNPARQSQLFLNSGTNVINKSEDTKTEGQSPIDPKHRFRRAESAGDVSGAAEAAINFVRNATPKNTTIDDVLRFKRVYHNSPHLLKKADGSFVDPETGERLGFDHRFMGSGEGAQAHGWGSYFSVKDLEEYATPDYNVFNGMRVTQNEAYVISNGGSTHTAYLLFLTIRDCCMRSSSTLNEKTVKKAVKEDLERMIQEEELSTKREGRLLEALKDNEPWAVAAISPLQESTVTDQKTGYRYTAYSGYSVENVRGLYERARHEVDSYKEILSFTERNPDYVEHFASKIQRHKYVVEIPDPDTNHYIEKDRRLTKHEVEMIRDALNDNPEAKDSLLVDKLRRGCTGGEAYELLSLGLGEEQASRLLNKAGFVGIHYNGKYDGECYVIFNENDAKITDHYRFRRAEREGDVSGVAEAVSDFMRNATPKNTTVDDVLRFLRVYHNSPHLLKKADGSFVDPETGERLGFDHRFMGSGEGAQAHGWGSYFSVKDLEGYGQTEQLIPYEGMPEMTISKDDLSQYTDEQKRWAEMILDLYNDGEGDVGNTFISPLERLYSDRSAFDELYDSQEDANTRWDYFVDFCKNRIEEDVRPFHNKYVVEIPNLSDGNYLEEDAPLSEKQASAIKQTMKEKSGSEYDETFYSDFANRHPDWNALSGGNLYKTLSDYLLKEYTDSPSQAAQWTSEMLNEAGFVGIHYNGQRDGECYVIFNEKDAKITDHYRFRRTTAEEREKIIEKANKYGLWMHTPDGSPTTLSEEAWITARTIGFKAEYGDWEKSSNGKWLLGNHYVKELSGNEFEKSETSLIDMVANYYEREHHGCAFRNGIGYVSLSKRTVKDSMAHFSLYRDRVAAFKAVPEVIKRGVQIDGETEWKGRSYDSLTISAPISIGGEGYICTVIVKLVGDDSHGKFYLHKIDLQKNLREELSENNTSENTLGEIEAVVKPHISTGSTPLTIANVLKEYVSHKDDLPESFYQANGEPKREIVEEYLKAEDEKEIRYRRVKADPMNAISPINPQWDGEWYSPEDLTGKSTADLLELPAAPATPEKRPTQSVASYAETMSRHYADPRVRFRTGAHTENLRAPQPPRITDGMSLYEVAQLQHEYNRNYRDFSEESMRRMGALDKLPEKFIRSQIDVARPVELFVEEMKRLGMEVSPDVVGQIAIFAKTSIEPTLL